jgi:hypothetical protein
MLAGIVSTLIISTITIILPLVAFGLCVIVVVCRLLNLRKNWKGHPMNDNNDKPTWLNFTNILIGIVIAAHGVTWTAVFNMNDKLFKHMTNDEIHAPRSMYVPSTTFDLYQKFREMQIKTQDDKNNSQYYELRNSIQRITDLVEKHMEQSDRRWFRGLPRRLQAHTYNRRNGISLKTLPRMFAGEETPCRYFS